ncbi:hypothetical protein ACFV1W_14370 [Kitasatospora sp. NPDC059648]|uniref:hypothetical protein n=1 Tax=Kitasatospora sp. NPDC059648 TaxID=3346894 RepID=UPI0036B86F58
MNEEVAGLLRDAAEQHQPDRTRIQARMERGMTPAATRHHGPRVRRSWPKAALVSVATAGIVAVSVAVAAVVRTSPPRPDIATAPTSTATATVSPTPSVPPTGSPAPTVPTGKPTPNVPTGGSAPNVPSGRPAPDVPTGSPASAVPTGNPSRSPSGSTQARQGALSSDGSVDPHSTIYWAQSNLTLKTTQPLATLTVELRIAQTGGVQSTGYWQTLPADWFTVTVQDQGGALIYRWTLKPGCTVPPGQHVFAAQYNHATGPRDPRDDTYRADASDSDGALAVEGHLSSPR